MARQRRKFTKEFKDDVVKMVVEGGKSIAGVARDLDLTESSVSNWVKQAKAADQDGALGSGVTLEERTELMRLRREVRELRMERDFLKKKRWRTSRAKRNEVRCDSETT
jgi:transposase